MGRIAVLDHGSGNLHSVSRALAKVGAEVVVTGDAAEAERADALVVPGVGHFGACVRSLRGRGLDATILAVVASGRPVLGVCVGMQVLFEGSDEDPERGLAVFPGCARRLPAGVTVPHMGWNTVAWTRAHPFTAGIPDGTSFYFVHSFAPQVGSVTVGETEHGRRFSAAVADANVFATQFHPEKSGEAGLHLYENVVREVRAA
ncbi:MAG: imidazole glycerol phosphate synthase subunit HisH [Planctomycetaceae bacterium]